MQKRASTLVSEKEERAWLRDPEDAALPSLGWPISGYVVLDGEYLSSPAITTANAPRVFPNRSLLRRFVGLAWRSDETIVAFGREWGLLGLCQHGLAPAHALAKSGEGVRCEPIVRDGLVYESLAAWRDHSEQARAMLRLASAVHSGGAGTPEDWAAIGIEQWRVGVLQWNLSAVVNRWLELAGVVPRMTWLNPKRTQLGQPRVVLDGDGLFGGIAAMLLLAVARSEAVVTCSEPGCLAFAEPARRGAKPYCALHGGPGTRDRDRAARFRQGNPGYYSAARRVARAQEREARSQRSSS